MINNEGYTKRVVSNDSDTKEENAIAKELAEALSYGESNSHVIYLMKKLDEIKKARLKKTL